MLSVWYSPPPTVGNESGSGTRVEGKEINLVRTEEDVVLDSPVVRDGDGRACGGGDHPV